MRKQIAVLGAGSWGTTFAALLAPHRQVTLWARRSDVADEITYRHMNSTYLGDHRLPDELRCTSSIAEALEGAEIVVLALPSHGMRPLLSSSELPPSVEIVVSLTKGLEETSNLRMSELIEDCWHPRHVGVLTGPNLAREILIGQPTASVIAANEHVVADRCQELFGTPTFRVYTNPDVIGCEIAGVAKNVMAIAIGMATGLGLGDNTRATLITRSLAEISRLGEALGGDRQTFAGLAGLGDLVATSLSPQSRNFALGYEIGRGRSIEDLVTGSRMVAEGFRSCRPVVGLADQHGIDVPVAREVVAVCHEGSTPQDATRRLMSRAATAEFNGR